MSEPAAKHPSIDLDEFERRLRGPSAAPPSRDDPLAELARLVEGGGRLRAGATRLPKATYPPRVVSAVDRHAQQAAPPTADFGPDSFAAAPPEDPVSFAADPAGSYEAASYEDEPLAAEGPIENGARRPPRSHRALYVLSGALALVFAGIAFTFVMKGAALGDGEAPTIKAQAGPIKVHPAHPGGIAVADRDSSFLDRSGGSVVSPSHVVDHREEPIDLRTMESRPAAGAAAQRAPGQGAAAANTAGYFPAPKRVHTVRVRPDGTIITDAPSPAHSSVAGDNGVVSDASADAAAAASPAGASDEKTPLARPASPVGASDEKTPLARPASPKTAARVATTPFTTAGVAGTADTGTAALAGHRAAHSGEPSVAPAASAKPARIAEASLSDHAGRARSSSAWADGTYAVQLAAGVSERRAKVELTRLEKRFKVDLRGRHTAVEKANSKGLTVYRVRVVGLSSDEANILCSRLKAGGGACFVTRE